MTIKVNANEKELKTYVFMILDKSGSMSNVREETISHFNEQLQTIQSSQSNKMKNFVSLTTFNSDVNEVFFNKSASECSEISESHYEPSGLTCMFDAVGDVLEKASKIKDINDDNVSALVVILSDGKENSSKRHTAEGIASKIKELQDTGRWTFTYIGANQDLSSVSKTLNIPLGNTLNFNSNSVGVSAMSNTQRKYLGGYFTARSYGTKSTRGFYGSDK